MSKSVFISYSSKDVSYKNTFKKHLKVLENEGIIHIWDGDLIRIGTEWDSKIKQKLKETDIFIILLSPDSVISEYINDIEIKLAFKSRKIILPIIIRPCNWFSLPLSKYQCLPKKGKPISKFKDKDQIFSDVVSEIRKKIVSEDNINIEKNNHQLFDTSYNRKFNELLSKIKTSIEKSIVLMEDIPLRKEKRQNKTALMIDKSGHEQKVFDLCFEFINQRNDLLKIIQYRNTNKISRIELIFENIFSYISLDRVGFDISSEKWKSLYKSELYDLLNQLLQTIYKN